MNYFINGIKSQIIGVQRQLWNGHRPIDGVECLFWNDITVVPEFDNRNKSNRESYH